MKILYVAHYSRFYGANRSLLQLIEHMRDNYDVEPMVLLPHHGPFVDELIKMGVAYEIQKFHSWLKPKGSFIKSMLKHIVNYFLFKKINHFFVNKNYKLDLIHTNTSATDLGSYLSTKLKVPHIWHVREYGEKDYGLKYTLGRKHAAKRFNTSDSIIAISNDIKDFYASFINSNSIKVIYNGVYPPEKFKKAYFEGGRIKVSFIGSISDSKNQLEVIKACEFLISKKNFLNFELSIIGEGTTSYIDDIKKYVQEKKLNSHIKFIGYLPSVYDHLKTSDLGIVSSKSEAFGRVTIEYMLHNMPVIGSNAGANPELITHGVSGYLYELGNYQELANYILTFALNSEKVRIMGEQAYNIAMKNYSSQMNAKLIHEVYTKLINRTIRK